MAYETLLETERLLVATSGRVMVGHFFASPVIEDLRRLGDREVAWAEQLGGKIAVASLISPTVGMKMDKATRAAAADVQRRCSPFMAANVTIIEEGGFFSSIARSVIMSISLLSRDAVPTRAAASREEATKLCVDGLTAAGYPVAHDAVLSLIEEVANAPRASG